MIQASQKKTVEQLANFLRVSSAAKILPVAGPA